MSILFEILSDLVKIKDVLFVVKSSAVTSEIRSNSLSIHQREKWVTIGENDGPCHMHVNSELIKKAEFITKKLPERTSYSIQFFDSENERVLAGFFTKMYDGDKNLDQIRMKLYEELLQKYGRIIEF